ncbi:MAG TPA: hypothetical protein PKK50_00140 [Myxococcota bacterium]|nr:hypothetical protein [Myxococcota bacterium]HNZ02528.1 hypothetical protein [Myxococcota bacterium]HOD06504.1 hypothetical protein [Myxococcota bacterium]
MSTDGSLCGVNPKSGHPEQEKTGFYKPLWLNGTKSAKISLWQGVGFCWCCLKRRKGLKKLFFRHLYRFLGGRITMKMMRAWWQETAKNWSRGSLSGLADGVKVVLTQVSGLEVTR